VGVPTLHALALSAGESACTVALLPAGRGEVYAQKLSVTSYGELRPLDNPAHLRPERLLESVSSIHSLKWAGEGAHLHAEEIQARALSEGYGFKRAGMDAVVENNEWLLVSVEEVLAASVGRIASVDMACKSQRAPQDLRAIYVRPSDAELKVQ
jgi:tRNA A37 threonylcarbamoyladenosine modification protein TsaB